MGVVVAWSVVVVVGAGVLLVVVEEGVEASLLLGEEAVFE